jgi:hypothetical protein
LKHKSGKKQKFKKTAKQKGMKIVQLALRLTALSSFNGQSNNFLLAIAEATEVL